MRRLRLRQALGPPHWYAPGASSSSPLRLHRCTPHRYKDYSCDAGVEYIVSDTIFEGLPPDEQRLWHSHAYEVKAGLWTDVGVPESLQSSEMASLAKTHGKFGSLPECILLTLGNQSFYRGLKKKHSEK